MGIILFLIIQSSNELSAAKAYLRGRELYSRGKYAEAIGEFRKALILDSTLTEIYIDLGWVLLDYGKADSAESIYRQIIKRYPDNACYHYVYAWILINQEKYNESMKETNSAIALDTQSPDYYYTRAYLYYYWKYDAEKAEKDLHKALDLTNNHFTSILVLGSILHDRGQYEKEKELYKNSLKYKTNSWLDLYYRGEIALRAENWQEASRTFDELYKLNPDYKGIACRLADCCAMLGYNDRALSLYNEYISKYPQDMYAYKALGILYYNLKLYGEAKRILIKANMLFPDSVAFEVLLGYVYSDQNPDSALLWINRSKSKKVNDLSLYDYIALVYMATDSFATAAEYLRILLQTDSTNARYWSNLGNSYLRIKEYDSAGICFRRSIKYDSLIATNYTGLGRIKTKEQEYKSAINLYEKALSIDSLNTYALSGLGRVCLQTGDTIYAMHCFNRAVRINPFLWEDYGYIIFYDWQNADVKGLKKNLFSAISQDGRSYQPHVLLTEIYSREFKDDSALIFANKALVIESDLPGLYIIIGNLYLEQGNDAKALPYFLKAYDCGSSDSLIQAVVCQHLFDLNELEKSKERLLVLLRNHPQLALPHYTIGLIYIRENKYPEAVQELNKYLEFKPDAHDKKFVEEMITDIKKYINN